MKRLSFNYILKVLAFGLLTAVSITACNDDFDLDKDDANGVPVDIAVKLSFPTPEDREVLSRSADGKLDLQIYDLMVFAFDSRGNLAQRYFFRNLDTGINGCEPADSSDETATLLLPSLSGTEVGLLNMRVPAGNGYLMAVANVEIKSNNLLAKLKNITTRNELLELQTTESNYDSDVSVLSGAYMENPVTSSKEFDPSGALVFRSGTLPGRIHMVSTAASVLVNVNGKGPNSAGGVFTLESYELVNLPSSTPMITEIGKVTDANTQLINTGQLSVFDEIENNGYSFGFGLLEYKGTGSADISKYGDRAAWSGTDNRGYKNFTNAPANAPYLILRGSYSGKSEYYDQDGNKQTGNVMADVQYYIFLGHNSGSGSPEGLRDFSTLRNWQYTYNITVNGIKDITVEVNLKQDNYRDDVEGDVIAMEGTDFRFDSHYAQKEFTMTVGEMRELAKRELLGFRVIVPAYNVDATMFLKKNSAADYDYLNENAGGWGVHNEVTGQIIAGSTEYYKKKGYMDMNNLACVAADWLKFYVNTTDESDAASSAPAKVNYADKLKSLDSSNNPQLLSIFRFLMKLNSYAKSTRLDSDVITFTVFVQENHYENNWNDRMVMSHGSSGTSGNIDWSQFVNVGDRRVLLFPTTNISTDQASTFSNPRIAISQRSIRTIYKPEPGYKAWGTESMEEFYQAVAKPDWFKGSDWTIGRRMIRTAEHTTKKVNFSTNAAASSTTSKYGRKAAYDALRGKQWTTYLNYNSKYLNYSSYRLSGNVRINTNGSVSDMVAACLGRNRDLNGNGVIDANEIRWYVPGISQLQALYVGNSGLPTEARLYQKEANEGKWVYKHYLSATRYDGDGSNAVLWAEEGPSTGQMNDSYAYGVHVRCVRDLGTDLSKGEDAWSGFYELKAGGSGNAAGYVDIDKLNDNCIRHALENKDLSGIITTFSNSNRPAKSFWYANRYLNTGYTKTFNYTNGKSYTVPDWTSPYLVSIDTENRKSEFMPQQRSLCAKNFGQGWRTPTITEVAILYWAGVIKRDESAMSRTRYTFWQQDNRGGIDIINNTGNDTKGRDPHSFSEKEFRLRFPWHNVQVPTTSAAGNVTQISGHYGGILCVKDKF